LRIVSLLASATEIVCALGAGEQLVGRSHECDNPSWVRSLPGCSEPAFDIGVSSGDIDREVRRLIRAGEPLYRIHTDRIRQLAPDLIVAQSHCEVCAVTPGDVERNNCLGSARVLSLSASTVEEVFSSILDVARALGLEQQGLELVARERKRLERLRQRTSGRRRPSVVVLEWADPIFPMSNWGPELVEAANGALALGNAGEHSSAIPSEHVREADPELLVVAPCGFDLNRSIQELPVLERNPWWPELRAVRERKVIFADGNLFFNRAGTTVVRTAEMLAEMMHGIVSGERTYGRHWRWIEDVYAAGRATA
jgi:iron complex transport system substrate-binding protein